MFREERKSEEQVMRQRGATEAARCPGNGNQGEVCFHIAILACRFPITI
jgi:hypothetical protein